MPVRLSEHYSARRGVLTIYASSVQAVDRALIVDTLPSNDQADANAWAARMLGVGSVAGYFMYVLHRYLPTLGLTAVQRQR